MTAKICPSCAHENDENDKFCGNCATPLATEGFGAPPGRATPAPKTSVPRRKVGPFIGIAIAMAILPVGFLVFMGGGGGCTGSVEGQLEVTGQPHGDYVMHPTSCFSGEHESFFGVWVANDLHDEGGSTGFKGGLKLVKEHTGEWSAFLESPNECQSFNCVIREVEAANCSVFEIDVHNTNTTINDIRVREGTARLDCTFPEGGTLKAQLTFDGCS